MEVELGKIILRLSENAERQLRIRAAEEGGESLGYVVSMGLKALMPDKITDQDVDESRNLLRSKKG